MSWHVDLALRGRSEVWCALGLVWWSSPSCCLLGTRQPLCNRTTLSFRYVVQLSAIWYGVLSDWCSQVTLPDHCLRGQIGQPYSPEPWFEGQPPAFLYIRTFIDCLYLCHFFFLFNVTLQNNVQSLTFTCTLLAPNVEHHIVFNRWSLMCDVHILLFMLKRKYCWYTSIVGILTHAAPVVLFRGASTFSVHHADLLNQSLIGLEVSNHLTVSLAPVHLRLWVFIVQPHTNEFACCHYSLRVAAFWIGRWWLIVATPQGTCLSCTLDYGNTAKTVFDLHCSR